MKTSLRPPRQADDQLITYIEEPQSGKLRSYRFRYDLAPLTLNRERTLHHFEVARIKKDWREHFAMLAKIQRVPQLAACTIVVRHFCKTRRLCDVAACVPAAKSAIDGLVDSQVLPDDSPLYVRQVTFEAPTYTGKDGLELEVIEVRQ